MHRLFLALLATLAVSSPVMAQDDTPITGASKREVVETLGDRLRDTYVFPDTAETTATELMRRFEAGAYDDAATHASFAEQLNADLREVGNDGHFGVRFRPDFRARAEGEQGPPDQAEIEQMRSDMAQNGYGIYRTAHLPGNVGYLDVRFFGPPEFVAPAYAAAIELLSGSRAIIIDLRSNGGGDPASVAQLASHFFALGDERHLNSIYNRPMDTTREFWTVPTALPRFTGPVYVLTSDYTFSGGEEFAYDIQTQKRGVLIGETTGGGANPGAMVSISNGLVAFIPSGRAINPITKTNWEHTGVAPEHPVSAEEAMAVAYRMALAGAIEAEADSEQRSRLEELAASPTADIAEFPGWKHPRE